MGILSASKDRMLESMALSRLNGSVLEPYGRATNLRVDSGAKTVEIDLELKGEAELVQIQLRGCELRKEGDRIHFTVKEVNTSREWLTALARNHLLSRPVELPAQAGGFLMRFL